MIFFLRHLSLSIAALTLAGCSGVYEDEELPMSDQEYEEFQTFHPTGAIKKGVFHMQRVGNTAGVLVHDKIYLKRPDLPPFDVAYISRNVESILLELANAAGESVVIPQGVRQRNVTIVHSGANFQEMLDIILAKVGYHYDYVDGVWYITRFPTRTYALEMGQSERAGSLVSSAEFTPEQGENSSGTVSSSSELDTKYSDEIWKQVESTLGELIEVGNTDASSRTSSGGVNIEGEFVSPEITDDSPDEADVFSGITSTQVAGSDHLSPEERANPWYKITQGAGLITVRAAPEAHRLIEGYLDQVQENSLKQVQIEVRILALIKNHETDRGANINSDLEIGDSVLGSLGFSSTEAISEAVAQGTIFQATSQRAAGVDGRDLDIIMQLLSTRGTLHTVTSPSVLARNNQISRISLTRQLGYAETEVEQNTSSSGDVVIGSRTDIPKFKNAGTVLSVFPYIGKQKIQLRMRLSIASKSGDTPIQTRVGTEETVTNLVPELSNNVVDQDMVLEYGRVYAVSKLVETSSDATRDYIPGLSDLPGMREVLQRATTTKSDTEFIVLVRVTRS